MRARKGQLATKSEARVVKKRSWEEGEEDDCGETNASANEEEELEEGKGFFACYLLTSLCPRYKGRTYIGFTVNPRRRIRQHNGEIRCGAWRTKRGRPWEMALCIYGFPSNVSALQFEWAWQHPRESLAVRKAASSFKSLSGITNKIKIVYTMLSLPAWENLNLTVNFFSTKYMKYTAGCPKLPNQMKTIFCIMDELPCYIKGPILDDNGEDDDGEDNHIEDSLSTSLDVLVNHVEADANHVQRTARHSLGTCRKHDDFGESIDLEESPCSRESPNATEESDDDEVGVANLVGKGKAFSDNLNLWRDFGGIRKPMEITKSYCLIESPKQGEEYSGTSSGRTQLSCSEDLFDFLKQNDLESFKQESTPGSSNKKASFGSLHHLPESNVINLLSPPSCLIGFCSNKHKKTSVPMDIIDLTDSPISL